MPEKKLPRASKNLRRSKSWPTRSKKASPDFNPWLAPTDNFLTQLKVYTDVYNLANNPYLIPPRRLLDGDQDWIDRYNENIENIKEIMYPNPSLDDSKAKVAGGNFNSEKTTSKERIRFCLFLTTLIIIITLIPFLYVSYN